MKTNKFWMLVVAVCTMLVLALPLSAQNKGKESKSDTKQTQSAPATSAKLDLNTASLKDLEALPGVGAATARKIIAGRPYASIADLKKAGVPQRTIDKIQGQVTVSSGNAPRATQGAQSTSSKSSAASSEIPARSSQRPKG